MIISNKTTFILKYGLEGDEGSIIGEAASMEEGFAQIKRILGDSYDKIPPISRFCGDEYIFNFVLYENSGPKNGRNSAWIKISKIYPYFQDINTFEIGYNVKPHKDYSIFG